MKQKLRLGDKYALFKHKNLSCVQTHAQAPALPGLGLAIGVLLLFASTVSSQTNIQQPQHPADSIMPLVIGDTIPEALWHLPLQVVNHSEGRDTITLDDYRDKKLIILDFWATWCKPCLESLNKLDAIRDSTFRTELEVIPVQAFDSERRAIAFLEKHQWTRYSVVNDPVLHSTAFSRYVTAFGTVWIADGRLYAIPMYEEITAENIAKVINGEHMDMENQPEQPITNK